MKIQKPDSLRMKNCVDSALQYFLTSEEDLVTIERRRSEKQMKNSSVMFDVFHMIIGVLIVILTVLAFLNPETNRILFPVIFFLASVLLFANGYDKLRRAHVRSRKRTAGAVLMMAGAGFFFLCVLSALTIWWG